MIKHNKFRIFIALALAIVLLIVLISACDAIGIGGGEPPRRGPAKAGILAPADGSQVLVGAPVQIQSAHSGDISRVELLAQAEDREQPTLLRADAPDNGVVLQRLLLNRVGRFTAQVGAETADKREQ